MKQLHVANELLGNKAALDQAWERDGYWFFKGVLDKDAVARVRAEYIRELVAMGVVDPGDESVRYNGASLEGLPGRAYGLEVLKGKHVWEPFTQTPAVRAFFKELLGEEPSWLPIGEYRAVAPTTDRTGDRKAYVHQDSFYNQGIPFRICWIPLVPIDEAVGGMIIAEGVHKGPCLHDTNNPPIFPIPEGAIPESAWRRADYEPGDLLMMEMGVPHTAINNHSDRFRLSMDIRMLTDAAYQPAIGPILAIDESSITVMDRDGKERTFRIDANTYCRGGSQDRVSARELARQMRPGDLVMVGGIDGLATVVRPQH